MVSDGKDYKTKKKSDSKIRERKKAFRSYVKKVLLMVFNIFIVSMATTKNLNKKKNLKQKV